MRRGIRIGDYVEVNLECLRAKVELDTYVFCAHVARIELDGSLTVVGEDLPRGTDFRLNILNGYPVTLVRRALPHNLVQRANKQRNTPVGELSD